MHQHPTQKLIDSVTGITCQSIPPHARAVAKHCVLDWFGVALAGSREPLSTILVRELVCGGGRDARSSAIPSAQAWSTPRSSTAPPRTRSTSMTRTP